MMILMMMMMIDDDGDDVVNDDDDDLYDIDEEFLSNVHIEAGKILFIRFRSSRFLNPESQICLL